MVRLRKAHHGINIRLPSDFERVSKKTKQHRKEVSKAPENGQLAEKDSANASLSGEIRILKYRLDLLNEAQLTSARAVVTAEQSRPRQSAQWLNSGSHGLRMLLSTGSSSTKQKVLTFYSNIHCAVVGYQMISSFSISKTSWTEASSNSTKLQFLASNKLQQL